MKVVRLLAICVVGVTLATSIASAQTYTAVNYPGAAATELIGGPNPQGTSVGNYTNIAGSGVFHGFSLTAKGVFTSFDPPLSVNTSPNFINPEGVIVGSYTDSGGVSHGFILSGGNYTTVDYPGAAGTVLSSINPSGEISGSYCATAALCASPGTFHSFVISKKGAFSAGFDPPGATGSETSVVIPSGAIVGAYDTSVEGTCFNFCQGYLLFHGQYATINYPGSTFTFAGGANANGNIVGVYFDAVLGVDHAFLLSGGVYTSFDYPGANFTEATGINPSNVIVGVYATPADPANVFHGFIRTP